MIDRRTPPERPVVRFEIREDVESGMCTEPEGTVIGQLEQQP